MMVARKARMVGSLGEGASHWACSGMHLILVTIAQRERQVDIVATAKIIILFQIHDGFVEVIAWDSLELLE